MKARSVLRRWSGEEAGIILPLVLVFLALGLLLLTPALGHGYTALGGTSVTETLAGQMHAADSGVEEGLFWLTRGMPGTEYEAADPANPDDGPWTRSISYPLNGNNVYVTITRTTNEEYQEHLYLIESRAETPEGDPATVLAMVYAVPFVTVIEGPWTQNDDFDGDLAVDGDLTVGTGNTTITGTVTVDGDLDMGQGAEIIGDVYASGDISLGQSSRIECEVLCTGGNLTLGQATDIDPLSVDVVTEVHFLNPDGSVLVFDNTATLTGDVYSAGDLTIHMYHKHNTLTGNIYVDGDLIIDMTGSQSQASVVGPFISQGGLTNVYATGDVYIRMDSKFSKVDGHLYYISGNAYTKVGSSQATWPTEHVCADADACSWPESDLDCPAFPSNESEILAWEVT